MKTPAGGIIILVTILLLCFSAKAEEMTLTNSYKPNVAWDTGDYSLGITFTLLHAIDGLQTLDYYKHQDEERFKNVYEANGIAAWVMDKHGEFGLLTFMVVTEVVAIWGADWIGDNWGGAGRKTFLGIVSGLKLGVIYNNNKVGAKVEMAFK
ncbi:MAG: hypothetical protein DRI71_06770 [Bacteroidetes bacterium]|nr:MAG: hypothetical protein DRI71_06770 [Bacteroidota bacterium]